MGVVLSIVILEESLTEELLLSVKVSKQVMVSLGLDVVELSCNVAEEPNVARVVSLVHVYVGVRVPSLRSLPEPEQVSNSVTVAVLGEILTLPMVGSVF